MSHCALDQGVLNFDGAAHGLDELRNSITNHRRLTAPSFLRGRCGCLRNLKAKSSATSAEKIERLMGVIWEVKESDKLQTFAEKILRWAEIGESETAIRQQLAAYHFREFGKSPKQGRQ
jgi:hypothetical protein